MINDIKRLLRFLPLSIIILSCTEQNSQVSNGIRIPGEFEPQEAIWLGYRSVREEGYFENETYKILSAISPTIEVNLIVEGDSLIPEGKMKLQNMGFDTSKINLIIQEPTDAWYRDNGPIFGIKAEQALFVAGFQNKYERLTPNRKAVADHLGIEYIPSEVVMVGGSFETNGSGTVILCEQVTLRENQTLTKDKIEKELKEKFNLQTVIWMKEGVDPLGSFNRIVGNYYGRGTGGHTDEFVRFANDSTILISWITEEEAKNHPVDSLLHFRLKSNYNILKKAKDHTGRSFNVIKVPHPDPDPEPWVADKEKKEFGILPGDSLYWLGARSYMNFVFCNELVLIPAYWEKGKPEALRSEDDEALQIFKQVFPNRKIIPIQLNELKWEGGGMHCRYQSQPKLISSN